MKTPAAFAAVLFAASQLFAQSQTTTDQTTPPKAPEVKPADKKVTPAAKTPVKADEKKPVPEPKIPGTTIVRGNGTFLGLEVADGLFKLSFYDKKKKPMVPDVLRAIARWPNTRGPGDNRTVLNLSGNSLIGQKPVVPPFSWNVYLTLLKDGGDPAKPEQVETFVVPFHS
jgi:hypothetical protein